jgi:APA family basic amino acid/polyamine antiporter
MMYYLVAERPLQAALGMLIMVSGLLIYALFHQRPGRSGPTLSPDRE